MKFPWVAIGLVLGLVASCNGKDKPADEQPVRQRRDPPPPARGVRPLAPHAIRAGGIGPYKVGTPVAELLDQLPSGPRLASFTIPNLVHRDMLRAEDGAILIGAEPQGKATFVAVVRPEIARTEAGIHVGSTRDELARSLGAPVDDPDHARDPHLVIPSNMKNARIILDDDRILAFVVTGDTESASVTGKEPAGEPCTRPPSDLDKGLFGVCLTSVGDLMRINDDVVELLTRDGEKPLAATARIAGLVFAVPLRNPLDGRDDIIAISRVTDESQVQTWSLSAYHLVEGKLIRTIEPFLLYSLTGANARWIGAELRDVDLYLELTSRADSIEVGGLLTTRAGDKIRDVVVISPVTAPRRRSKTQPHEPVDAGTTDASTERAPR